MDKQLDPRYTISDLFCRENTSSVRALAIIEIVLCHLGGMDKVPLNPVFAFTPFGYLGVALFFFFSGYNLYFNCMAKPDSWYKGFWKKKFFRICLPFFISNLLFELFSFINGSQYSGPGDLLLGVLGIKLKNNTLWYIRSILLFYLLCYICFMLYPLFRRMVSKRLYLTVSALPVMLVYHYFTSRYSAFSHFTVTVPMPFLVGALIALWGDYILPFWTRHRGKLILALTFLLILSHIYAKDKELMLYIGSVEVFMTCATVALPLLAMTILIGKKISVPILNFLDKYSLEMYLLHYMCLLLYMSVFGIKNHYLFLAAYLGTLLLLSIGLNKLCALCRRCFDALFSRPAGQPAA